MQGAGAGLLVMVDGRRVKGAGLLVTVVQGAGLLVTVMQGAGLLVTCPSQVPGDRQAWAGPGQDFW